MSGLMSQWTMSCVVQRADRVGDLRADRGDRTGDDAAALDELAEVFAVEELHHEIRGAVGGATGARRISSRPGCETADAIWCSANRRSMMSSCLCQSGSRILSAPALVRGDVCAEVDAARAAARDDAEDPVVAELERGRAAPALPARESPVPPSGSLLRGCNPSSRATAKAPVMPIRSRPCFRAVRDSAKTPTRQR